MGDLGGECLGTGLHPASQIEERKEKTWGFAGGGDVCFLSGGEASGKLRPIWNAELGTQRLKSLRRRGCGVALKVEKYSGVGTQRAECPGDQQAELLFAEAAGNVGGAEAENEIEELLAELADFGGARDGERREWIVAKEDGAATSNVGELGGEGTSGVGDFRLQKKHGMKLNGGLRDAERLAKQIGLGLVERGENENEIQVGSSAKLAFGGAPEEHNGEEISAKGILCGSEKRVKSLGKRRRKLRQRKWRGGTHRRPRASRNRCYDDARMPRGESQRSESQRTAPRESR
jgi:hypothetical protein